MTEQVTQVKPFTNNKVSQLFFFTYWKDFTITYKLQNNTMKCSKPAISYTVTTKSCLCGVTLHYITLINLYSASTQSLMR